ncbi:hypothetical protein JMA_38770 (plasmid) [Jeotgalibacillus malaysiensis]|uniref:Uncharacterized protein n=1 Tax=Jeotgalibacillus malaysiensis TaxID=1508404 RepID=A0A0B5ASK2_9BACL|nr:hypothetical protein [Jeotgalibacillus malaysiensis]AJD93195.1 hypothetical protein JMA_38770 [Jeotgalibacillus malaysiensis]
MTVLLGCLITFASFLIIVLYLQSEENGNVGFHVLLSFIGFMGFISFVYSIREMSMMI